MKALKKTPTKGIQVGTVINISDNSGIRLLKVIQVKKYRGVKRRLARAGIGDVVIGSVKAGKPGTKKQVLMAVVIRQRRAYARIDGSRVRFEDNAGIIVTDAEGTPKATRVKGSVAKEVIERYPVIGKLVSIVA